MRSPPEPCLHTHGAGPFRWHKLEPCKSTNPAVDSSPAAEDEQRPSYSVERENEMEDDQRDADDVSEDVGRPVIEWCQCGRGMCPVCSDQ